MCEIIDRIEKRGEAKGEAKGRIETLIELVRDGDLTIERAAQKANLTVEEFTAKITARC